MITTPPGARPLSLATRLFYGVGAVAYGVKDNGFSFLLLLYYNQVLGLPEERVGVAILLALVLDAFLDPLIGHWSDGLRSRWGRRHPFLYASALPVAVSYALLWLPPAGLSQDGLFLYLLGTAVLVRSCLSVYEIPSSSLVAELTADYDQRTRLLAWRYFFGWWGGLTMAVVAYAVFLQPDAAHPVGVLNPDGYRRYAVVAAVVMAAAILVSAAGTHAHIPTLMPPPPPRPFDLRRTASELKETLANRSFLVLFASGIFSSMAAGLAYALTIYLNTWFWGLTSDQMSLLNLGYFGSALLALLLGPAVSRRLGKRPAALVVTSLAVVLAPMPVTLRLLGLFPENGAPDLLPTLFAFNFAEVTLMITSAILVSSMVADVVEDSEATTGRRSEGLFFAARSFVAKAVSGVGVLLSTVMLAAVGFPRDAKPEAVDPEVLRSLGSIYAPTVFALYALSLAFVAAYGISRDSHRATLGRLGRAEEG